MQTNDINILQFYSDLKYQERKRGWNFERPIPLVSEINQIPPFWIPRLKKPAGVSDVLIVNSNTGVSTSIYSELVTVGLEVKTYASEDYEVIRYPSLVAVPGLSITEGIYYLIVSDETETWYSDEFQVCSDMVGYIKVEFWHNELFYFNNKNYFLDYSGNVKNKVYLKGDLSFPEYPVIREVEQRDGEELVTKYVRAKEYSFNFVAPESWVDGITCIPAHDKVVFTYRGKEYESRLTRIEEPEWLRGGSFARIKMIFRTDTIVSTYGALDEAPQTVQDCYGVDITAKALLVEGSAGYTSGYYLDSQTNAQVNFETGDIILRKESGNDRWMPYEWNGSAFVFYSFPASPPQVLYIENSGQFWVYDSGEASFVRGAYITSINKLADPDVITGGGISDTVLGIFGVNDAGEEISLGSALPSDLEAGLQLDSGSFTRFRLKQYKIGCGFMQNSEDYIIDSEACAVVGVAVVGTDIIC